MKARVIAAFTSKAGDHVPGDTVEGRTAQKLVTAGYAVPVVENRINTADASKAKIETR